jgi:hypothetical protein
MDGWMGGWMILKIVRYTTFGVIFTVRSYDDCRSVAVPIPPIKPRHGLPHSNDRLQLK